MGDLIGAEVESKALRQLQLKNARDAKRNARLCERYLEEGDILVVEGDLSGAETAFRTALQYNPHHAEAHASLGNLLRQTKNLTGAEAEYREVLKTKPKHLIARFHLGLVLWCMDDDAGAVVEFNQLLCFHPHDVDTLSILGHLLMKSGVPGDIDKAEAHLRASLNIDPLHPSTRKYLSDLLDQKGDLPGAEAEFRAALKIASKHAKFHWGSNRISDAYDVKFDGMHLLHRGELAGAEKLFRKDVAIATSYRCSTQCHNLGLLLQIKGDLTGAEALYRFALRMSLFDRYRSGEEEYRCLLFLLLSAQGDHEGARRELSDRMIADFSRLRYLGDNPISLTRDAFFNIYNISPEPGFQPALLCGGSFDYIEHRVAKELTAMGDFIGAEAEYRAALDIDPGNVETRLHLGKILYARGDLAGAEAEYRAALKIDPTHRNTLFKFGLILKGKWGLCWCHCSKVHGRTYDRSI